MKPSGREHQTPSSAPRVPLTPAADRTFDILEFITNNGQTQAATLARRLDIPRPTVYQLLEISKRHELVIRLAKQYAYDIGPKIFELGLAYSCQHRVSWAARLVLARLVDEISEDGHLTVLHGSKIIYAIEEYAVHRPSLVSGVGVCLPSHLTTAGRVIPSAPLRNQVRALYLDRQAFINRTSIGPKSFKELKAMLAETRCIGSAEEHGDVTSGFNPYTVIIRDYNDFLIAELVFTFVSGSLRSKQERSLKTKLQPAGTGLSRCFDAVDSPT